MSKSILKCGGASFALIVGSFSAATAQVETQPAGNVFGPQSVQGHFGDLDAFGGDLDAFWGDLDAFWGDLDAFYGDLDAFWGDLDAFGGDLDAFWGDLDAFWGDLDAFWGDLDAFYGDLDAFWGDLDAFYGDLDAFSGSPEELKTSVEGVFESAKSNFRKIVKEKAGRSFNKEVRNPLLKKYGVKLDYSNVDTLTRRQYAALMLELQDKLMTFTGLDHVDHWMATTNWTPTLSRDSGAGAGVVVGLLDTPITNSNLIGGRVKMSEGFGLSVADHGAGVASVLAGAHDGAGVMGVAPDVDFVVFNPFDDTFTAGWTDVTQGIETLVGRDAASIINLSLGVDGYVLHSEWSGVFNTWTTGWGIADVLVVKSAGNSGISQTEDVNLWFSAVPGNIIFVGSVDAGGTISDFSNRPGTACLISWFECRDGNRLMDRFLVAPGENILVQDNKGNLSRVSGTSVAAPLVSGAAALIQSQWPWLKSDPTATSEILFQTATDLGAPGVDEVYGRGLLNIEAATQPIDRSQLYVELSDGRYSINALGGVTSEVLALVGDDNVVTVFEDVIGKARRDFDVPLTDLDLDTVGTAETSTDSYLTNWMSSGTGLISTLSYYSDTKNAAPVGFAFTNFSKTATGIIGSDRSAWSASFFAQPLELDAARADDALGFAMRGTFVHNNSGLSIDAGQGHGAVAFSEGSDFGLSSDHNREFGGVNPVLGLASGGFFVGMEMPIAGALQLNFGYTENSNTNGYRDAISGELMAATNGLTDYQAGAINAGISVALSDRISVGTSVTRLTEQTGLLGGQGAGILNLSGGAQTDAITFESTTKFDRGVSVSASLTGASTSSTSFDGSILAVGESGLAASAFQIAGSKQGVFHATDRMRLSIGQPLHVENGAITLTTSQVVDRETGQTAFVTDILDTDNAERRFVSELIYATPLHDGAAELTTFGMVDVNNMDLGTAETVVSGGVKFNFSF